MKQYFSIKNFEKLQHYKDRNPPWIKLYNSLLDDYEFSCLQDASKLHLICIWLLASRTDNKIPWDTGWIQKKIGVSNKVNLDELERAGFINKINSSGDCSNRLAERYQDAIPEQRRAEESRGGKFTPPSPDDVREYCKERDNGIDPQRFVDHYEANGWVRGKTKIKDWKAAVRTWEKNGQQTERYGEGGI